MPDPTISPKWHKIQLYVAVVIRELSVTVGKYENVRYIVGLQTFFLLDALDKDLVKGYLTLNGKHHEAFQGKSTLKQGVVIQLQPRGKRSIPVQRLEGFMAPYLVCSFSLHFFMFIRKIGVFLVFFLTHSQQKGRKQTSDAIEVSATQVVIRTVPVLSAGWNIRAPSSRWAWGPLWWWEVQDFRIISNPPIQGNHKVWCSGSLSTCPQLFRCSSCPVDVLRDKCLQGQWLCSAHLYGPYRVASTIPQCCLTLWGGPKCWSAKIL